MRSGIIMLALVLFSTHLFAQKDKADEKYKLFEYALAIPLYEKYVADNPTDYDAMSRLAKSYKLTNNVPKAIEAYKKLIELPESKPEDLFEIVQLFQIVQNESDARKYANIYKQKMPGEKAENLIRSLDGYAHFMSTANDYTITNKTSNYPFSILSAYPMSGKLIVTAENRKSKSSKWTGRSFTDLYITDPDFTSLDEFAANIMTDLDDGIPTFTSSNQIMYLTSVNKKTIKENDINTRKLHIVLSELKNGEWTTPVDFPYNSNAYSTAHPTISSDGNLLVFSSDMPGGKGGMDLYYCVKQGNGWSAPQNITALNTYGNEIFPVFQNTGELFFSSNGLPGLGGLDIFRSKVSGSVFSAPENMMAPINSSFDDYYLKSEDNLQSGYLTSNRFGNTQIDNVLRFEKAKQATPAPSPAQTGLKVLVVDKYTKTPLPYVSVTVKDNNGNVVHKGLTDEKGKVDIDDLRKGAYTIQGELNGVTTSIADISESEFTSGTPFISKEIYHNDPRFTLAGIAINTKTNAPLPDVLISCVNTNAGISKKTTTGADGKFLFQLEQNSDFEVQGQKKGWLSSEIATKTTKGLDRSQQLYVNLELKIEQPVSKGTITLKKIHYDYNKCDIRPDAAVELDRLVKLLNDYPDMVIELSSHTDSRGADVYNLKLSQCRADAAVAYLIKQGIAKSRLTAKGYGETRLLNGCSNGVKCTEDQHAENRRTEFTILSCQTCPH